MLYGRRKRLEDLDRREAEGEDLFTRDFPANVRTKIAQAVELVTDPLVMAQVWGAAQQLIIHDEGVRSLTDEYYTENDMRKYLAHYDDVPTSVEALYIALQGTYTSTGRSYQQNSEAMQALVNRAFAEHRIAWELVEGQMVDFDSKELHVAVTAPLLRLLAGRAGWDSVEASYQSALEEIGQDPADAITDAGTALQAALELRGCEGNALGPLVKDALKKGILAPHDQTLGRAIKSIIDWASADRSQLGDAHPGPKPSSSDAWLTVHIVGALILRLAEPEHRDRVSD